MQQSTYNRDQRPTILLISIIELSTKVTSKESIRNRERKCLLLQSKIYKFIAKQTSLENLFLLHHTNIVSTKYKMKIIIVD